MFTSAEVITIISVLLTPLLGGMGGIFTYLVKSYNGRLADKDAEFVRMLTDKNAQIARLTGERDSAQETLMRSLGITESLDQTLRHSLVTTAEAVKMATKDAG